MGLSRTVSCAMLIAAVGLAPQAHGEPADQAVAEALFHDGRELYVAGKLAPACAKFAESQRIDPKLGTLLNLASCHEELGKTATAWAEFTQAATQATRAHQDERADYARAHAAALEGRLSRFTIVLRQRAPGLSIRIDKVELGEGAVGTALPVDPGEHEVVVSASGKQSWRTSVTVAVGPASTSIDAPDLESDAPASAPASTSAAPAPDQTAPPEGSGRRLLAWSLLATSAVGAGIGSYFGLRAFAKRSDANAECTGNACSQRGLDLYSDVKVSGNISTIAFGVSLTSAAVAVYLFATGGASTSKAASRGVRLVPVVEARGAAAALEGRW